MTWPKEKTGSDEAVLKAYFLGTVPFETFLQFQKRLHFDISGDRSQAALILCEHPPLLTVGRQGSRAHISFEDEELRARQWPVRWVARGGGCFLHLPGQLAIYPLLPLDRMELSVRGFLQQLNQVMQALLADFSVYRTSSSLSGVWAGSRLLAGMGVAVRDWITTFGAYFNLDPDLAAYRYVRCGPQTEEPMTSLARERGGLVRPALVRQRLLEHFQLRFGFSRVALFTDHPALHPQPAPTATWRTAYGRCSISQDLGERFISPQRGVI